MRTTRTKIAALILAVLLAACAFTGCKKEGAGEISVKMLPAKTEYYVGDTVDLSGGVLLNGKTEIAMTAQGVTAAYSTEAASEAAPVVITYAGVAATFNIRVIGVSRISVAMTPEKSAVVTGGQADLTGGTLAVVYADGHTREVPMTDGAVKLLNFSSEEAAPQGKRVGISYYGAVTYCFFGIVAPITLDALADEAFDYIYIYPAEPERLMPIYYSFLSVKGTFKETNDDKKIIKRISELMLDYWKTLGEGLVNEYSALTSLESIERAAYAIREMYCGTVQRELFAEETSILFIAAMLENVMYNFGFQAELAAYMNAAAPAATAEFAEKAIDSALKGRIGFIDLLDYFSDDDILGGLTEVLYPGWGEVVAGKSNKGDDTEAYEAWAQSLEGIPQGVFDIYFRTLNLDVVNKYLEAKIAAGANELTDVYTAIEAVDSLDKDYGDEEATAKLQALEAAYNALSDGYKTVLIEIKAIIIFMPRVLPSLNIIFAENADFSAVAYDDLLDMFRLILALQG